jgi:predicted kinase
MKLLKQLMELGLPFIIRPVAKIMGQEKRPEEYDVVYREYREKLVFPERNVRAEPSTVVCMIGLVGSGKSTVARMIAKRLNAVLINGDAIRVVLRHQEMDYSLARLIAEDLVCEIVGLGYNVVLDSDFIDSRKRASMRALVSTIGADICFVRVHVDPNKAYSRIDAAADRGEIEEFFTHAKVTNQTTPIGTQHHGAEVKKFEMGRRTLLHYEDKAGTILRALPFECDLEINTAAPQMDIAGQIDRWALTTVPRT